MPSAVSSGSRLWLVLFTVFVLTTGCDDEAACPQGGCFSPTSSTSSSTTLTDTTTFQIDLGVTNDVGLLGAIQFDLRFLGATGGWVGAAASVRCVTLVPTALATFNDKGGGMLSGAMIDLDGIPTPGDLARCSFRSREAITADSFEVDVVDAADTLGAKPAVMPVMAVISIVTLDAPGNDTP